MTSTIKVDTIQNSAGTTGISIDSSGIVKTGNNNPQFFATLSGLVGSLTDETNVDIPFDTVSQVGSGFSTSTGKFTCPVSGIYIFCGHVYAYSVKQAEIALMKNNTKILRATTPQAASDVNPNGSSLSTVITCAANDVIHLQCFANTDSGGNWAIYHADGASHFSGYLIG